MSRRRYPTAPIVQQTSASETEGDSPVFKAVASTSSTRDRIFARPTSEHSSSHERSVPDCLNEHSLHPQNYRAKLQTVKGDLVLLF